MAPQSDTLYSKKDFGGLTNHSLKSAFKTPSGSNVKAWIGVKSDLQNDTNSQVSDKSAHINPMSTIQNRTKEALGVKTQVGFDTMSKVKKIMTWWWIWPRDANLKCLIMAATVWKDAGPAETWNGQWKPCKTCWTLWQKFAMSTWPGLCLCFRLPLWESFRFGASFGNCSFGDL